MGFTNGKDLLRSYNAQVINEGFKSLEEMISEAIAAAYEAGVAEGESQMPSQDFFYLEAEIVRDINKKFGLPGNKKQARNIIHYLLENDQPYWYPWQMRTALLVYFQTTILDATITRYFREFKCIAFRPDPKKNSYLYVLPERQEKEVKNAK